jgi:hypothetical protein
MSSGNYDFCFKKSFVKRFRYETSAGVAIDTSGWTGKMTIRYKDSSNSRFTLDLTTANGKLVLSPTYPHITVTASLTDLADMPSEDEHDYALELYPGNGQVEGIVDGVVTKNYSPVF